MEPGQLLKPGQVNDPVVNFASVYGLTSVTVHVSFSCPAKNIAPTGRHLSSKMADRISSLKADFLSWQKLLATIFFQKKSVK